MKCFLTDNAPFTKQVMNMVILFLTMVHLTRRLSSLLPIRETLSIQRGQHPVDRQQLLSSYEQWTPRLHPNPRLH